MSEVTFRRRLWLLWTVLAICLLVPLAATAQSTTEGGISGTVSDPQGAVVPNATVVVHHQGTNAEQTVTTDASGFFRVTRLQPAMYTVTVSVQGFSSYKVTNVTVNVGSTTEIAAHLKPAGSTETVEVTGEAPQINTTSAEFAPVVNETAIRNLPINGGRWSNFVLLTPGVVNDSNGFGLVSFRGMSTLLNNNTIDGADNNQAFFSEERGRTRIGYSTPKAAIQEFQVNTANYSAEYGRAAGGVINTVTKSGTNQLHGEGYFFDRDNAWGATNPYTTITQQTSPGVFTTTPYKPKDWRKMTGFGIGGPIIKDKLFFFLAFDYYKRNFPGTSVASDPKTFFATPTCNAPAPDQPCTQASNIGVLSYRWYGANTLANNALAAARYTDALNALLTTSGPTPRTGEQNIWLPKIDWQINAKNHLSFVVNRMRWDSPAGIQTQATNTYGISSFGNDGVKVTWGVVKLSTSLTNSLVNEFRAQYGRDFEFQSPQTPTEYEMDNLVGSALYPSYTNPYGLPPEVTIQNGWNLGVANFLTRPKYPDERRQQYTDNMSWSKGKHLLKWGVDFTHAYDNTANLRYQFGSFSYSNSTGVKIGSTSNISVPALINYLSDLYATKSCTATISGVLTQIPCYNQMQQAFGPLGFNLSTNDYGFYAQDEWRVTPKLTLTLGLRYDYEQMPSPFTELINPDVPQTGKLPSDKNNFGPRVGFAWDPWGDGKTSIRGGYAITYGRIINSTIYNALTNTGMVGGQFQYSLSPTSSTTSRCALAFPQIYPADGTGLNCSAGKSLVYFDDNFQAPLVQHVTFSVQHEIMRNTVVAVNYLGSFGRDLADFVDKNINESTTDITYSVVGGGPLTDSTITVPLYQKPRPNANYGAMTDIISQTTSSYHALVAQISRSMTNHLQFNSNFTWSHAIDYGQNNTTFTSSNAVLDPYNFQWEKGNSNQNIPMRFVFSAVAESPWKVNGWAGWLANGWQFSPLYQWQNGLPYSARTGGSIPSALNALAGGMNGSGGDFRVYGLRNQFRQPNTQVFDAKIMKELRFRERYNLQLSGEFFNVLNHQNVTSVSTTAYTVGGTSGAPTLTYNSNFGKPNNSNSNFAYSPRQIQLGVRFGF